MTMRGAKPARPIRNVWAKTPYLSEAEVAKFFAGVNRARDAACGRAKESYLTSREGDIEALTQQMERINSLISEISANRSAREMRTIQ